MKQIPILMTPEQGKALIAKAIASLPEVEEALEQGTIVVIAGTTNRYVARELLKKIGVEDELPLFYRGATVPRGAKLPASGNVYDVVIQKGQRVEGKTIFDMAPEMGVGDIIFKGANAVNLSAGEAGVLVGNPKLGTTLPLTEAVYGRRVKSIIPVGVEKRVELPINTLCALSTEAESGGPRLAPLPGEVFTEQEAISVLYEIEAEIFAAGGILGAEGAVYFLCSGDEEEIRRLEADLKAL